MKGRYRKLRRWISLLTVSALLACTVPVFSVEAENSTEDSGLIDLSAVPENIRSLLDVEDNSVQTRSVNSSNTVSDLQIVDTDDLNSIRVESSDGQGTAKVFATPIRYENDEGEIEFIDTSMTQEGFFTSLIFSEYT